MENGTVGSHVATVAALSRSALFYDISRGNGDLSFYINHHTGVINTRKRLDFEVGCAEVVSVAWNVNEWKVQEKCDFCFFCSKRRPTFWWCVH